VGVWGRSSGTGRAEEQARELEIPWPMEQWLCGPMGQGLVCSSDCSFSKSWYGDAFHKPGVQSSGPLPQPMCLHCLSKVPGSCGLWLCPSRHLGSPSFLVFKTFLLKSSFLFFKVSFLRLSLSHVFSLAFLKSRCSDLQTNNGRHI
jgi:hypothetical protein